MESVVRGRGKNKRGWTAKEDEKLVEALLDLCVNGNWKSENGFKNGYLQQLEKVLEEKLPRCGLKAHPHIESRVKTLKSKLNALNEMLNKSGFSWNDQDKMLVCERAVYDEWVRTHKDASGLYGKPFPHLDALGEIFGKDRVNGLGAETFADVVKEFDRKERNNDNGDIGVDSMDDIEVSDTQSHTSTPSERGGSRQPCRKRVRRADTMATNLENLAGNIGTFFQEIVAHFGRIAGALEHQKEISEKTSKVVEELLKIDGLSIDDVITAADILAAKPSKIIVFFSMPDNLKRQYVERICAGN